MKKIKIDNQSNILSKFMAGRYFEDFNKSVVVLANPKTILNAKFAKKEVKEKVIRADQLVKYIKEMYEKSKEAADTEERMLAWAQYYLNLHKDVEKEYTEKYEQFKISTSIPKTSYEEIPTPIEKKSIVTAEKSTIAVKKSTIIADKIPLEETNIFKELKAYRLNKSREENIKPYFIYNDNQLKDLISKMPSNKEELQTVAGFGETKVNKYGNDILKIVEKY